MKPLLIVNPAANGGRTREMWDSLRRPIERALGPCEIAFTEHRGHATTIARDGATTFDRIVAVGGDGTFSEVAAGVLQTKAAPAVGLIHQGTGGDFRRSLGLEHRLDRYLACIAAGDARAIDAGLIRYTGLTGETEERHFVNIASIGMGGLVDKYVAEGTRLLGPAGTYLAATVKALASGAVGRLACAVTIDDRTESVPIETRNLSVCNGRFFGGGMEIAPMARLDDGAFSVVYMDGGSRLRLLRAMTDVYDGGHVRHRGVKHFPASAITIRLTNAEDNDRFLVDVDGELAGTGPVEARVLPGALRVLMPRLRDQ